jgi:CRP/FNR family transcriptional regulator
MGCICELQAGNQYVTSPSCIGQLWIFENLKPEELAALVRAALRKVFKKGQEVFCQGAPANKMFLIKAGRVKLSKFTEDGDEITLDIRKLPTRLVSQFLLRPGDPPARCRRKGCWP